MIMLYKRIYRELLVRRHGVVIKGNLVVGRDGYIRCDFTNDYWNEPETQIINRPNAFYYKYRNK